MAVKLLTQMVTQERLQGTRNGALEYMIAGDQQVPYVTCLRVTLDDRNHNVVTAALQLLHAVVAADAELALLVHLQPLGSFEGGPFEGLLALDSCTDIEMASDGGAMQGREPSSPEELKASINANVCIALLSMNLLPRLRYSAAKKGRRGCVHQHRTLLMGGATPAARSAGNCRGTGDMVPFCTCGSHMAKWAYAFGAHLGLCHASCVFLPTSLTQN